MGTYAGFEIAVGRKAGELFSDNGISPCGITAMLRSVAKLTSEEKCAAVLNIKFNPMT